MHPLYFRVFLLLAIFFASANFTQSVDAATIMQTGGLKMKTLAQATVKAEVSVRGFVTDIKGMMITVTTPGKGYITSPDDGATTLMRFDISKATIWRGEATSSASRVVMNDEVFVTANKIGNVAVADTVQVIFRQSDNNAIGARLSARAKVKQSEVASKVPVNSASEGFFTKIWKGIFGK